MTTQLYQPIGFEESKENLEVVGKQEKWIYLS